MTSIINALTIEHEIVYVKQPQPTPPYRVKWKLKLGNQKFDYFTGLGHIKNYKKHTTLYTENELLVLLKTGKPKWPTTNNSLQLITPKLDDIIYCLLLDSEVLNYAGFEEWCSDFGYNSDSISDKKIYDDCLSNSLRLSSVIDIHELRPLFHNY